MLTSRKHKSTVEGGQRLFYCFCSGVAASQMVWRAVLPAKIREKQCVQPEEQIYVRQVDCTLRSTFSMWPRFPRGCNLSSFSFSRSKRFSQDARESFFRIRRTRHHSTIVPYSRKPLFTPGYVLSRFKFDSPTVDVTPLQVESIWSVNFI